VTWQPRWYKTALAAAAANGWNLVEQPNGRLAFSDLKPWADRLAFSSERVSPIESTGNDDDAPRAIAAAVAAMKGAAVPASDPIAGIDTAIKQGTDRISSAVPIAKAIIDGRKAMGLASKMALLADRVKSVPAALEAKADALLPRLDALEARGAPAFDDLAAVILDAEKGVAAAEAAMRLLTNGGPPLSDSGDSKNGV
jgi:hypothetical protein